MSVMSKTTNGKNDRIELAATEKAKVWTSVRIKYLKVERSSPERRRGAGGRGRGGVDAALDGVEVGGMDTERLILSEGAKRAGRRKPKFQRRLPSYFLICVKVMRNDLKSY